ncbi:MAG: hypothetical protein WDO69_26650 [Pseudomonadota bacterium]
MSKSSWIFRINPRTHCMPRRGGTGVGSCSAWRSPTALRWASAAWLTKAIARPWTGGALAWTRLQGHGFDSNSTDSGFSVGGYAALRFILNDSPLHFFVTAAPLFWFDNATSATWETIGKPRRLPRNSRHLNQYLARFPQGRFAARVDRQLSKLHGKAR